MTMGCDFVHLSGMHIYEYSEGSIHGDGLASPADLARRQANQGGDRVVTDLGNFFAAVKFGGMLRTG